jgi:hypothetical protein
MKFSAIAQRGSKKDFIDIYAIGLNGFDLRNGLSLFRKNSEFEK